MVNQLKKDGYALILEWMPYELAPDASLEGEDLYDYLPKERIEQSMAQLNALGKEFGLEFNNKGKKFNTRRAHLAGYYAKDHGVYDEYSTKVFEAYFMHGKNVAKKEVLDEIASALGLDAEEMNRLVDSGAYEERLWSDFSVADAHRVNLVPTFIVNDEMRFAGAMNYEQFKSHFEQTDK